MASFETDLKTDFQSNIVRDRHVQPKLLQSDRKIEFTFGKGHQPLPNIPI